MREIGDIDPGRDISFLNSLNDNRLFNCRATWPPQFCQGEAQRGLSDQPFVLQNLPRFWDCLRGSIFVLASIRNPLGRTML